jgi:hypothetical protein
MAIGGWGHEDLDFLERLDAVGLAREYRYGTFTGLDQHRSDGLDFEGAW